jgi:hypothetical protein
MSPLRITAAHHGCAQRLRITAAHHGCASRLRISARIVQTLRITSGLDVAASA